MATKTGHRTAFANDPSFLERLARQGISLADGKVSDFSRSPSSQDEATPHKSKAQTRLEKVRDANMDGRRDRLFYDPRTNTLAVTFPGAVLLSLNVMLRVHDAKGTGLKSTWKKRIEALRYTSKGVFDHWLANATFPVIIEEIYITRESHLLDPESVCAACKPIIDAFVTNGFLPDDSPAHVAHPMPYTEKGSQSGLLIRFRPSPRAWGLIEDTAIEHARSALA